MRWTGAEAEWLPSRKELVDTVLVPVVPLRFGDGAAESGSAAELVLHVAGRLESQLTGRLLLLPPITYFSDWNPETIRDQLELFRESLEKVGFKMVLFIGTEKELPGNIRYLRIPPIPLANMEERYKKGVVEKEIGRIMEEIIRVWQSEEMAEHSADSGK
mgnify:CR=1 FL=1